MSAAVAAKGRRGGSPGLIAGVVAVAAIVLGFFFFNRADPPLERQATGMAALPGWLKDNDIHALLFQGGRQIPKNQVSLRILPLYDTDLLRRRGQPETRAEVIEQTSEYDLSRFVLMRKLEVVRTLLVLPKWRSGVRELGIAHRDLLIPEEELNGLMGQLDLTGVEIVTDAGGMATRQVDIGGTGFALRLMHAQTVTAGKACVPLVGDRSSMLLGRCKGRDGARFWLLSDPDLLSNHGLALGQNGAAVLKILEMVTPGPPEGTERDPDAAVLIDMSVGVWVVDDRYFRDRYERKWEDFVRMFKWPFTMIWIGFFALAGLILWRAIVRYGPLMRLASGEPGATKTVSIAAKARLLRLADHDEELLRSHIHHRLARLAADLLGPHRRHRGDPLEALIPMIERQDRELATAFETSARATTGDVMSRLDRFETLHDRIRDEFGRPASADRRPA